MREQLQRIDLTQQTVHVPDALSNAITTLRADIAKELATTDLETGWTPAYSLSPADRAHTAEFLIYSALTTVARRPDVRLVVDRELAIRAGGRQHADDQHLRLDLGKLLLHLPRLRHGAVHL